MNFERLTSSDSDAYKKAMELYKASFPLHEQREAASQMNIMKNQSYHFNLICEQGQWVGIILCWETAGFIYVEHFCILPQMRNRQYGQRALALLGKTKKTIILEIDPPTEAVSIHRKAFYERSGYFANDFAHVHPAYCRGLAGHGLVVMSAPCALSGAEYKAFNDYLQQVVMGS